MGYPLTFNGKEFLLRRYPKTSQTSLRPFSNAELLVLREVKEKITTENIYLFNDRFGIWNCALHQANLTTIWNYASQKKAVMQNLNADETQILDLGSGNGIIAWEASRLNPKAQLTLNRRFNSCYCIFNTKCKKCSFLMWRYLNAASTPSFWLGVIQSTISLWAWA